MTDITGTPAATEEEGPFGRAVKLPLPPGEQSEETVCHWLLTAPAAHPLWTQYVLAVVRLRDLPGWPPPKRQFQGATHELIVVALSPEHGPYTAENMTRFHDGGEMAGRLPYLTPINIAHQIEGSDEEAESLAAWAAWGVVAGHLNPETADAPTRVREDWKTSLVKTLAHIRGGVHAR